MVSNDVSILLERLDRIEAAVATLIDRQTVKEWYSIDELSKYLHRAEFTVREWCRHGRIHAEKKGSGRGKFQCWVVSHRELLRIQKEGLLPIRQLG